MFSDAVPQVEAGDPPSSAQREVLLTADHKPDLVDVSVTRNQSDSSDDGGAVDFAEILQESEKKERELPPSFIHQYALGVTRMPTVSAHCIKVRIKDGIKEVSVPAYVMIEGVPCPVLDTYAADFSKIIRDVGLPKQRTAGMEHSVDGFIDVPGMKELPKGDFCGSNLSGSQLMYGCRKDFTKAKNRPTHQYVQRDAKCCNKNCSEVQHREVIPPVIRIADYDRYKDYELMVVYHGKDCEKSEEW